MKRLPLLQIQEAACGVKKLTAQAAGLYNEFSYADR
jgi:hypothetical protein